MTKQEQQLPQYFREYLDERFGKVLDEIADVKQDVADLKKNVSGSNKRINRVVLAVILIAVIFLFHLGESSGNLLKDVIKFL